MPQKIFISHRNVEQDLQLARVLHDELEIQEHEVFLDADDIQLGAEWPAVIRRELEQADVLVVLLSQHLAEHPDMVIEEVSMARQLKRRHGKPEIIPVCLGEDVIESLPYDLAAMVKRLQYATWTGGPRSTRELLYRLFQALEPEDPSRSPTTRSFSLGTEARPRRAEGGYRGGSPTAKEVPEALPLGLDEIPLPQPPKARYSSYWYVARAAAERQADACLREPGSPVVLVGPGDIGKSYLLDHLMAVHQGEGDRQFRLSLDVLDDVLDAEDDLFRELAYEMVDQLDLDDAAVDRAWEKKRARRAGIKLGYFMQTSVLPAVEGRLLMAFDGADAVADREGAQGLFRELRGWAELSGRRQPWDRLRLLLAISTEPGRLIDTLESSPFNISPPIRLEDLDSPQLLEMARRYGILLRTAELAELVELVGGHPYLVRKVLYEAVAGDKPVTDLLQDATAPQGLFGDHLRSRMLKVSGDQELAGAVRQVIHGDLSPIDAEIAHRLLSAGLIAGVPGSYRMRYKLYDLYFRQWLQA